MIVALFSNSGEDGGTYLRGPLIKGGGCIIFPKSWPELMIIFLKTSSVCKQQHKPFVDMKADPKV